MLRAVLLLAVALQAAVCLRLPDDIDGTITPQKKRSTISPLARVPPRLGTALDFLPIQDSVYGAPCPFAKWYAMCTTPASDCLPEGFKAEEERQVAQVNESWTEAGSETGIRLNDHNYDTDLGQGNTVGFVAATVTIESNLPKTVRHGLFEHAGAFPAVVRFSDFGADYRARHFIGLKRLMRMAVKVEQPSAWAGESNLLLTETIDSFPFANLEDLKTSSASSPGVGNLFSLAGLMREKGTGGETALTKDFYSQTPFALGPSLAMKTALKTRVRKCRFWSSRRSCCMRPGRKEKYWYQRIEEIVKFLNRCDAVFDIEVQWRPFTAQCDPESDANCFQILKNASAAWSEPYRKVGTLTIHKQPMTAAAAVGKQLQETLARLTGVDANKVDKIFAFHPIMNDEANRPVGEIGAFRAGFYSQNMAWRFSNMFEGVFKRIDSAVRMPFQQLKEAGVWPTVDLMRGDDR
eukprot:TRINITY_DN124133_c0_g1_i1.p1 TRINITY_DN124133_c0_g1~~TRINITY_DN124133_c0_g1_i1.p1  ORF type:complete len:464 (+),score=69.85 TRINITY_DN124133_c0_g1_i1:98-1489(+)